MIFFLRREGLRKFFFYGESSFKKSSMRRRPSKNFYGEEGYAGSWIEKRPCKSLLERKSLGKVFYRKKVVERSSIERIPLKGLI